MDMGDYFRIEATELIGRMTADLRELPSADADRAEALWKEIGRAAHTLKGAAHVVRQTEMARSAHDLEDAIAMRDIAQAARIVDGLASQLDGVPAVLPAVPAESKVASPPRSEEHGTGVETVRVALRTTDDLLSAIAECSGLLTAMRGAIDTLGRQRQEIVEAGRQVRSGTHALAQETLTRAAMDSRRLQADIGDCWTRLNRQIEEAERIAHTLRLAPAQDMLLRVERTVRRTAEQAGIVIECLVSGGDERADLHLLTIAEEALGHMARNAVVHGLAKKTTGGRVEVGVRREGSHLLFFCRDNGTGIDTEHLRVQAVNHGWMSAGNAETASREDLLDMLARPGVTTQTAAGPMAGRGIGLDVARSRARKVGGDVTIESVPGTGTTVTMRVPESLLALPCLVLEIADRQFAVPLAAIEQTKKLSEHRKGILSETYTSAGVLDCGPLLGLPRYGAGSFALEVQSPAGKISLGVDRIVRVDDLVIEPVPERWQSPDWIMGTYLDAGGHVRLVLDPMQLRRDVITASRSEPTPQQPLPQVLVIDDSLTSRTLIASILSSAGYSVETAISAEEGLEKARKGHHSLFFVDVEMPGMDGFEFVRITRADVRLHNIPAVMITSRNLPGDRDRGLSLGASEYIVKGDFDQNRLLEAAANLLRTQQRTAQRS